MNWIYKMLITITTWNRPDARWSKHDNHLIGLSWIFFSWIILLLPYCCCVGKSETLLYSINWNCKLCAILLKISKFNRFNRTMENGHELWSSTIIITTTATPTKTTTMKSHYYWMILNAIVYMIQAGCIKNEKLYKSKMWGEKQDKMLNSHNKSRLLKMKQNKPQKSIANTNRWTYSPIINVFSVREQ